MPMNEYGDEHMSQTLEKLDIFIHIRTMARNRPIFIVQNPFFYRSRAQIGLFFVQFRNFGHPIFCTNRNDGRKTAHEKILTRKKKKLPSDPRENQRAGSVKILIFRLCGR